MKGDAIDRHGTIARKGLWIVSKERNKTYGQIVCVKEDGTVVWNGRYGRRVTTNPNTVYERGYEYAEAPLPS